MEDATTDGAESIAMAKAALRPQLPRDLRYFDLLKPLALLALSVIPLVIVALIRDTWDEQWGAAVPGIILLLIIAVMIWPSAGTHRYFAYKRPLFILTIVAELWILLGGAALIFPDTVEDKAFWFQLMLIGFFLLTAVISLPGMTGEYRKGLFFRPDLLYGNGAYLARGEIFVALGVKLLITAEIAQPIWNWWGLTWAIAAMIIIVPFRGMLKMRMRRARLLALDNWMGSGPRLGLWVKETFLFVALILLVYGFANVYMGKAPYTWTPGDPMGMGGHPEWWGFAFLAAAFVILVPIRGWLKTRISEPPPLSLELIKQTVLWLGFLPLIYGFFLLFMGKWQPFHGFGYYNFWWGVWVSALGFLMVVPLRAITLREEFRGTMQIMVPRMADLSEEERRLMMEHRIRAFTAMPVAQRDRQVKLMIAVLGRLPQEKREAIMRTQIEILSGLEPEKRRRMMASMDKAMLGRA